MFCFLGIGAQKAGTTWLYECLSNHPQIYFPHGKEAHFWDRQNENRSIETYLRSFNKSNCCGGEITPSYSFLDEETIKKIHNSCPHLRIIYILRNPIERAWSSALMALDRSELKFSEASDNWFFDHFSSQGSLQRGNYYNNLRRWLSVFEHDNLILFRFEDISQQPLALLQACCNHLGISFSHSHFTSIYRIKVNETKKDLISANRFAFLLNIYTPLIRDLSQYLKVDFSDWLAPPEHMADDKYQSLTPHDRSKAYFYSDRYRQSFDHQSNLYNPSAITPCYDTEITDTASYPTSITPIPPETGNNSKYPVIEKKSQRAKFRRRTAVLVFGMHRSGTSAITRVLNIAGITLPDAITPPVPNNNETGFWEPQFLNDFNDQLFKSLGSIWYDWKPIQFHAIEETVQNEFRRQALSILETLFQEKNVLLIKDPRMCRLFPFWEPIFKAAGISIRAVIAVRSPLEVAQSLRERDDLEIPNSLMLWTRYILDAELFSRPYPRTFLHYQDLFLRFPSILRRVEAMLQGEIANNWAVIRDNIQDFLRLDLVHHTVDMNGIEVHGQISTWAKLIYSCLEHLTTDIGSSMCLEHIDKMRLRFDQVCQTFDPFLVLEDQTSKLLNITPLTYPQQGTRKSLFVHGFRNSLFLTPFDTSVSDEALKKRYTSIKLLTRKIETDEKIDLLIGLFDKEWYSSQVKSVSPQTDPIIDFLKRSNKKNISPNPLFDSQWYKKTYSVHDTDNCFVHFISQGYKTINNPNIYFNCIWYRWRYPEVEESQANPFLHFLTEGVYYGYQPHPLFDCIFYLRNSQKSRTQIVNPLLHFIQSGEIEGISPHPIFDGSWYLSKYGCQMEKPKRPLRHYLEEGAKSHHDPHPFFCEKWYQSQCSEISDSPGLVHFLMVGAQQKLSPHPLFDTAWYIKENPDISELCINPLIHYILEGYSEFRSPHPAFNIEWYTSQFDEEYPWVINPLRHYLCTEPHLTPDPHPLFDSSWYLSQLGDNFDGAITLLTHYIQVGAINGYSPHPLFDVNWYQNRVITAKSKDFNPLIHFLTDGWQTDAPPQPLFDFDWYRSQQSTRNDEENAFLHFITQGYKNAISPHPLFNSRWFSDRYKEIVPKGTNPLIFFIFNAKIISLDPHPLFDTEWYVNQRGFESLGDVNPLVDFLLDGYKSSFNPNPLFDCDWYLAQNPDVAKAQINPLVHYIRWGAKEGRNPHPLFDTAWYLEQDLGLLHQGASALERYFRKDELAKLSPHPLFDGRWYLANNPDVAELKRNPLVHFLRWGAGEGRDPHPLFDAAWYLEQNSDVEQAGANPLLHYLNCGAAEGRNPHPLFHTAWYVAQHKELLATSENPLVHFVRTGAREGLQPCPWFDTAWYLVQNPELAATEQNPLVHYLEVGGFNGCNPCLEFDNDWYLNEYPDVAAAGLNPLLHYLRTGITDGRRPNSDNLLPTRVTKGHGRMYDRMLRAAEHKGANADYVPADELALDPRALPLRAIAFYLPQFHPIPENDAWWGRGFTEWTNVAKAVPQFEGQDQPRLPDALGFYDLRLKETQHEQIRLARQHGIHGFCYHYYWFGGRRLLERPLEQMLADPSMDFPFCLCWANENWTRRWDGGDETVLIDQQHSPSDDLAFFESILPALRDPRYIRVDGSPLLLVYRPQLLPDPAATIKRWRKHAHAVGLGKLYLAAVLTFTDAVDPESVGFDAGVEFPPHRLRMVDITHKFELLNQLFRGRIFDYEACVHDAEYNHSSELDPDRKIHPCVMLGWDNTARRGAEGMIYAHSSPKAYGQWLAAACRRAMKFNRTDERLVFINAWNEWAEGTYLEPDRQYGYAWLQTTRQILSEASSTLAKAKQVVALQTMKPAPRLLYVGHDAHRHGAQYLTLHLLRVFAARFGYRLNLWLLGDGDLLTDYRRFAETKVFATGLETASCRATASELAAAGVDHAIVNTVVSGAVLPELTVNGFHCLSLIHEMPELIRERGLETRAQLCATHAETVVFASERVRDAFATVTTLNNEQTLVLPQGVYQNLKPPEDARARVEIELDLPQDVILVLNVGYGDRRKGFDIFLDCARTTTEADPRFHFLWVGNIEAGFNERLERERRHGQMITHLHHVPITDEVARYYAAANLFLLTSREDPFPSVVLEALCCGLPVVAFAGSGGHCDLLAAPNGLLVEPLGDAEALTRGVFDMAAAELAHPDWVGARAAAARRGFNFVEYAWQLLLRLDPRLQSVSILVPNYNYANYIAERLGSLFAQTYPVFEIIVLDDASTDTSEQEIQRCAQAWGRELRLIVNQENSGSVFAQWARCAREARGELLWIAEADDVVAPEFLARLAPKFAVDPELIFAFSDSAQIDNNGQHLGESYADYCNTHGTSLDFRKDFSVSGREFLRAGLSVKNTVLNVSAVLFRRDPLVAAMESLGWLENAAGDINADLPPATIKPDWRIAGDWRLYIELCRQDGRVHYLAEALNQHRRHQHSVVGSHALGRHAEEISRIHKIIKPDIGVDKNIAERQRAYRTEIEQCAAESEPTPTKPGTDEPSHG